MTRHERANSQFPSPSKPNSCRLTSAATGRDGFSIGVDAVQTKPADRPHLSEILARRDQIAAFQMMEQAADATRRRAAVYPRQLVLVGPAAPVQRGDRDREIGREHILLHALDQPFDRGARG